MNPVSIIVHHLSVTLQGKKLLDGISFRLHHGDHLAITGATGSGKTLLAQALAGNLFHKGTVELQPANRSVVLVEQHYQFRNLSHTTDFYYQQRYNSTDNEDAATVMEELNAICTDTAHVLHLLDALQFAHKASAKMLYLSSGEHKRFQLIRALLSEPDILILDEPFTGLDNVARDTLNQLLDGLAAKGTQVISISAAHEIPACITVVAELSQGRLVALTDKADYLQTHSTLGAPAVQRYSSFPPPLAEAPAFTTAVRMEDVTIQYEDRIILNKINWEVRRGEKWLVRGRNGAGKSTLLSLVYGDNPQTYANKIWLFDRRRGSGESIWDIKQKTGYISPELHWYFDRSISCYDVIASGFFDTIGLFKKLSTQQEQLIEQWLDLFRLSISHVQQQPLSAISTGEQRLTLLLRALVKDPPLLLLDEPCQGLDAAQTAQFVALVDDLCTQLDKTLVYISHYDDEIPGCIDKVLELKEGKQHIYYLNRKAALAV